MSKLSASMLCLVAACGSTTDPAPEMTPDAPMPPPPQPDASTCTIPADATVEGVLTLTADDNVALYVNGTLIDETPRVWSDVRQYTVTLKRRGDNTLAISGRNTQTVDGNDRGIIADLRTQEHGVIVTDGSWRVSPTATDGWHQPGYNTNTWQAPFVIGNATLAPWGDVFGTLATASTAQWIWTYDPNIGAGGKLNDEIVYSRKTFAFPAPGCQ